MHFSFVPTLLIGLCAITRIHATPVSPQAETGTSHPIHVSPGGVEDIIITAQNTLNATNNKPPARVPSIASTSQLPISLVNGIRAGPVTAYITGLDSSNRLVFVKSDGSFYYPTAPQGTTTPQQIPDSIIGIPLGAYGSTKQLTVGGYISSGRVYLGVGTLKFYTVYPPGAPGPTLVQPSAISPNDPSSGVKWGFIEFTTNKDGIYVNLSYVDFVGLVLGMGLKTGNGVTLTAKGLKPGSLQPMCDAMTAAGNDWPGLCMLDSTNAAIRVLGPQNYITLKNTAFSTYWTNYTNTVYSRFTSKPLKIQTPSHGNVSCKVSSGTLNCDGDNHSYAQPNAFDIFGCNTGPFQFYSDANSLHNEIYPRICAAFNRATLLRGRGDVQPSIPASRYYLTEPNNVYSKNVHKLSVDGKGYAFAYDDVTPPGGVDQSGSLADANPQLLTVYVGGQQ